MFDIYSAPVPIRIDASDLDARLKLAEVLQTATLAADRAGEMTEGTERILWYRVRDGLRKAASEAVLPASPHRRPHCRRCGTACPECAPTLGHEFVARDDGRDSCAYTEGYPVGASCGSSRAAHR